MNVTSMEKVITLTIEQAYSSNLQRSVIPLLGNFQTNQKLSLHLRGWGFVGELQEKLCFTL